MATWAFSLSATWFLFVSPAMPAFACLCRQHLPLVRHVFRSIHQSHFSVRRPFSGQFDLQRSAPQHAWIRRRHLHFTRRLVWGRCLLWGLPLRSATFPRLAALPLHCAHWRDALGSYKVTVQPPFWGTLSSTQQKKGRIDADVKLLLEHSTCTQNGL